MHLLFKEVRWPYYKKNVTIHYFRPDYIKFCAEFDSFKTEAARKTCYNMWRYRTDFVRMSKVLVE